MTSRGFRFLVLAAIGILFCATALPQSAGQGERGFSYRPFRVRFTDNPEIRFGDSLRLDFRFRYHNDFRLYSPDVDTDDGLHKISRLRVAVQGRFRRDYEFEVERELRDVAVPWRDNFLNYRRFRDAQIRAGYFRIPFGMEQNTGPMRLDFVYRTLMSDYLTPARDLGVMIHGRFNERALNYEVGLFRGDGDNARNADNVRTGMRTLAGRVSGRPLRLTKLPAFLREIQVGGAFTESPLPEGLNSLRGRSVAEEYLFRRIFVKGHRLRMNGEFLWTPGPFSIKSEFTHVREERKGQSLFATDLPHAIARGWYVSGTWLLTGEPKAEAIEPKRKFITGGGVGAVEAAGRFEVIRFGSAEHPGRPSRSTRAANILSNSDRIWTFGVNWYLNQWVKIQVNGAHETVEDLQRSPIPGQKKFWATLCRIQLTM
jgi:phosphate-selective porin OprO/OprP